MQGRAMDEAVNRISLGLFLVAFAAFGLIFSGVGNGNTVPRIALSLAIVEHGSLFIDDFAPFTEDKGTARGHYISDKAPGLSFLALPAVAVAAKAEHLHAADVRWIETDTESGVPHLTPELQRVQWVATLATSALYTALALVVLFRTALLLGVSMQGALFAALVYGFATPTWGWATTFFSHAPCGAFMVFALGAVVAATVPSDTQWTRLKSFATGTGAGVLLGMVIVLELTAAPAVACIGAFGLWRSLHATPNRTVMLVAGAVLGGLIVGAPFLLHNALLFENPFSVGYSHSLSPPGYAAIDFTVPSAAVAAQLIFGGGRGLLWLAPILLLAPLAWRATWQSGARALTLLCVAVFAAFLVINAAYVNWYAGAATGPRYLAPALPFLALPFAWLWDRSSVNARRALGSLAILSGVLCFAMASIQLFAPWDYQRQTSPVANVVAETLLPKLAKQDLPNLVLRQMGASRRVALWSYAGLIGGGLLLLWLSTSVAASSERRRRDTLRLREA